MTAPNPSVSGTTRQTQARSRSFGRASPTEPKVAKAPPNKIDNQIKNAGLPTGGQVPFVPALDKNRRGDDIIRKGTVQHGPRRGKRGYLDTAGRIWIKDRA